MAKTLWKDEYIVRVYNLAKSGLSERKMAQVIGISHHTFTVWEKKKKPFRIAVRQGRKEYGGRNGTVVSFRDYVFRRLPLELRKIWRRINKLDSMKSGGDQIEAILANRGKDVRQHLFIYAWTASNFSISTALRKVNMSRSTFERWKKEDTDFRKLILEINWHKKNFFEDALCKLIKGGDTSATIFANRSFNRDRGYNDKVEVDMNVSGEIDQTITSIDAIQLPLATRKEILESIRKRKKNSKI